jgi:hypothetical protein
MALYLLSNHIHQPCHKLQLPLRQKKKVGLSTMSPCFIDGNPLFCRPDVRYAAANGSSAEISSEKSTK